VHEIMLFKELQPPPPADIPRMREAARARLSAAASGAPGHPARPRHRTVMVVASAAALAAAGTSYGLAAVGGSPSAVPNGTSRAHVTTAGLTSVSGCPGTYITVGTLEKVSGTRLTTQPANNTDHVNRSWQAKPVTVDASGSTQITRPASGTVSEITDGAHVDVQGTWSGSTRVATQVGIEAALPSPRSFGPQVSGPPGNLRKLYGPTPKLHATNFAGPPFANGTVADAHRGSFTVVTDRPLLGVLRIHVITSSSTKIVTKASASLSQLTIGANVVVVGTIGAAGVLTASTVAEPSLMKIELAGSPVKVRTSSCTASAITTAAILAGA
jgi:hypothetical protein